MRKRDTDTDRDTEREREMLQGCLLSRGFSSQCKSCLKRVRYQIDLAKRRKSSIIRFLKKDIAQLLDNGLEDNAYRRVEGLIKEENLLSCYDLLDQFCGCILEQLPCMNKQRDCPPQSIEAVSTIIFAAARFADLPELRDLRHIFTERYDGTLEPSVNEEFVEKIASKPHSIAQKLQLLEDISQEFSISWDSKDFNDKISNPSELACDQSMKSDSPHSEQHEVETDTEDMHPITTNGHDHQPFDYNRPKEDTDPSNNNYNVIPPPPYVKPEGREYGTDSDAQHANSDHKCPPDHFSNNDGSSNLGISESDLNISENTQEGFDRTSHDKQVVVTAMSNIPSGDEKGHHQDYDVRYARPKPRSVRTKNPKPVVHENDTTTIGDRHGSTNPKDRRSQSISQDDGHDQEEKSTGKISIHYSDKPSTNEDAAHLDTESGVRPTRLYSSPLNPTSLTEVSMESIRATSFQPQMSSSNEGRVHPKLPDYDDLAVRLGSLNG